EARLDPVRGDGDGGALEDLLGRGADAEPPLQRGRGVREGAGQEVGGRDRAAPVGEEILRDAGGVTVHHQAHQRRRGVGIDLHVVDEQSAGTQVVGALQLLVGAVAAAVERGEELAEGGRIGAHRGTRRVRGERGGLEHASGEGGGRAAPAARSAQLSLSTSCRTSSAWKVSERRCFPVPGVRIPRATSVSTARWAATRETPRRSATKAAVTTGCSRSTGSSRRAEESARRPAAFSTRAASRVRTSYWMRCSVLPASSAT